MILILISGLVYIINYNYFIFLKESNWPFLLKWPTNKKQFLFYFIFFLRNLNNHWKDPKSELVDKISTLFAYKFKPDYT